MAGARCGECRCGGAICAGVSLLLAFPVVVVAAAVPLLFCSHRQIRIFGGLVALSMVFTSAAYSAAYVSVWCFFAAVLSLYLVYMIRRFVAESKSIGT